MFFLVTSKNMNILEEHWEQQAQKNAARIIKDLMAKTTQVSTLFVPRQLCSTMPSSNENMNANLWTNVVKLGKQNQTKKMEY